MIIRQISVKVAHRVSMGYSWLENEIWANAEISPTEDASKCIHELELQLVQHLLSKETCKQLIQKQAAAYKQPEETTMN